MRVLRFLTLRLLAMIPIGLGILTLTFILGNVIPADPVRAAAGPQASEETVQKIRSDFGLDRPLHIQYFTYLERLLHGDMGKSLVTRRPVREDLTTKVPASIELAAMATLLGVVPGIVLGVLSAVLKGRLIDHLSRLLAITGVSSPDFWTALVLQLVFGRLLGLFPITGRIDPNLAPIRVTGFNVVDSLLAGSLPGLISSLRHMMLPAVTLSLPMLAVVTRLTRSGMLDVLSRDFILNARVAAGLPERLVIFKFALKNALLAPTAQVGLSIAYLMGGAVIVETIFDWPGMGLYVVHAAIHNDLRPVMATTLVASMIYILFNAITDLVYTFLDPRIRV